MPGAFCCAVLARIGRQSQKRSDGQLDLIERLRLDVSLVGGPANAQSWELRRSALAEAAIMVTSDEDADWKAAEAALEAARRLPGGAARIEALKHAGRLRFDADRKRLAKEPRQTNQGRAQPKKIG
jgi:hypothetical protein